MKKFLLSAILLGLLATPLAAQSAPKKKRISDKKFWFAAALIVAASVADVESTVHWVKACPSCREMNSWIYGKRPTRRRMYLTLGALTAAEIWGMWYVKRDGGKAWTVIPVAHVGGHGGAAVYNYTRNYPPVCPALGAGCQ